MEFVEPIKNTCHIHKMKKILHCHSQRDFLFFVLGVNTGIRISDLLQVRVKDVWDGEKAREFYTPAAGIENSFYLNKVVRTALVDYLAESSLNAEDYLFKSRKNEFPITRQQAYRIINKAAQEAGVEGKIGTHTLRKTFGYHAYKKGIAVSILQKIFNHATASETLKYIGIDIHKEEPIRVDVNL
ncbi:tyrosine-type recombinase/integrase [Rossellomorea vietnamensis]|uniref:Tyrosine-type recombinase/integrase n=1 Tax=Rossellomorea vietnamensis TaxID=218284 RepID=A0A5D4MHG7_9BACI|nr:tyrosine-type recombinase/integrase [Rossellomorea vietnamensis]TYS01345.1 tyrosine-type recombinase/integrase [Rossellomorea vietnamensis]